MPPLDASLDMVSALYAILGGIIGVSSALFVLYRYARGARVGAAHAEVGTVGLLGDPGLDTGEDPEDEPGLLSAISLNLPYPAWVRDEVYGLLWRNAALDRMLGAEDATSVDMLPDVFRRSGAASELAAVDLTGAREEPDFEVTEVALDDGRHLGFATDIRELRAARRSLRRFVETLTETFAQLPIALAIFDQERRLQLFNPALGEMMGLDVVWMAGRPTLREFFEALRENRVMPEEANAPKWRNRLAEIEEQARASSWHEDWVLSTGQTLRASGRPHPNDAIAFLFEDVTISATLEKKYRGEIELSRATLDKLSEGVCVFNPAGDLVFANAAFLDMWSSTANPLPEDRNVRTVTAHISQLCMPSPSWGDLREFVTGSDNRAAWDAEFSTVEGYPLSGRFSPLPDGSTLTVFSYLQNRLDRPAHQPQKLAYLLDMVASRLTENDADSAQGDDALLVAEQLGQAVKHLASGPVPGGLAEYPASVQRLVVLLAHGLVEIGQVDREATPEVSDGGAELTVRFGLRTPENLDLEELLASHTAFRLFARAAARLGAVVGKDDAGDLRLTIPLRQHISKAV